MKWLTMTIGLVLSLGGIFAMPMQAIQADVDEATEVAIRIAPSVLILDMAQGGAITVHADIPYRLVDPETVQLEGIAATAVFADNCGNLVAKFDEAAIKADRQPGIVALELTGATLDGTAFAGTNTVKAIIWRKPAR